ncbi:hypothetical protein RB195_018155 [Necator americanus]|uniref:Carboxylesterase type B domain-containing protein n=1 Tax=Necator americanus TaxID=51031 RepID=A0ABR1CAU5_NECAM
MRNPVALILFYCTISFALKGKELSEDVIGYLGIPYAKPPLRDMRFKDSQVLPFDDGGVYTEWPAGCPGTSIEGRTEDCLFLSLLQVKNIVKKTNTLLIFANDKLSEKKLAGLVSPNLNIGLAAIRAGVLGSYGNSSFGVSDVINAVKFLKENEDVLGIGKITVWAESFEAEAVASALSEAGIERAILINGNAKTRAAGRDRVSSWTAYKIATELECDLPSAAQSTDCLRTKSLLELYVAMEKVSVSISDKGGEFVVMSRDLDMAIIGQYLDDATLYCSSSYGEFKKQCRHLNSLARDRKGCGVT